MRAAVNMHITYTIYVTQMCVPATQHIPTRSHTRGGMGRGPDALLFTRTKPLACAVCAGADDVQCGRQHGCEAGPAGGASRFGAQPPGAACTLCMLHCLLVLRSCLRLQSHGTIVTTGACLCKVPDGCSQASSSADAFVSPPAVPCRRVLWRGSRAITRRSCCLLRC